MSVSESSEPSYLLIEQSVIEGWQVMSGLSCVSGRYTAWATRQPMSATDPLLETADPLHFEFGSTRQDAITRLMASLPRGGGNN